MKTFTKLLQVVILKDAETNWKDNGQSKINKIHLHPYSNWCGTHMESDIFLWVLWISLSKFSTGTLMVELTAAFEMLTWLKLVFVSLFQRFCCFNEKHNLQTTPYYLKFVCFEPLKHLIIRKTFKNCSYVVCQVKILHCIAKKF